MSKPTTEAGRALLHSIDMIGEAENLNIDMPQKQKAILAIEAEAAQPSKALREALKRLVEALDKNTGWDHGLAGGYIAGAFIHARAVLTDTAPEGEQE